MTEYFEGIGRRKSSTARVRLMEGSGQIMVNGKELEDYFPRLGDAGKIRTVFQVASENIQSYDVSAVVKGGGVTGQSTAVQLGLARAIIKKSPEAQPNLKRAQLLTRDSREKERKKPGLKRARKAPTYTKR